MSRLLLIAIVLFGYSTIQAGDEIADIAISVRVVPEAPIPPGSLGTVIVTITNIGPAIGSALFRMRRTQGADGLAFPPLEFPGPVTGPCMLSPVGTPLPGEFFSVWVTRDLQAGESRTCTFGYRVVDTGLLSQFGRWTVSSIGAGTFDPNDENNTADVLLQFFPLPETRPVPTLSQFGLLILILIVIFFSIRRIS